MIPCNSLPIHYVFSNSLSKEIPDRSYLLFWGPSKLFFSRPLWHQSECGWGYQKHWMKIWEGTSRCAWCWLVLPCCQCTSELISFCLHGPCWSLHLPGHGRAIDEAQFSLLLLMYRLSTVFPLPTEKPITIKQLGLVKSFSDGFSQDFTLRCENCVFSDEADIYVNKMIHCLCSEGAMKCVFASPIAIFILYLKWIKLM